MGIFINNKNSKRLLRRSGGKNYVKYRAAASITYANSFSYPIASVSYSLSGTAPLAATLTGNGGNTDVRLWLLVNKTGTLSYTVTASSEAGFDGGRLCKTSLSPSQHTGISSGGAPAGLTAVSSFVSGTTSSTGTISVTAGEYLVLTYSQDEDGEAGANRITASLSIT